MKITIDLNHQNQPRFPELLEESDRRFYDLSCAATENNCVSGIIKMMCCKFPSIRYKPEIVLKEAFRVMTLHGMLMSRGYSADYYNNGINDLSWGTDVYWNEPSIKIPLTITQRMNLKKNEKNCLEEYRLKAEVNKMASIMNVFFSEETLKRMEQIWDMERDDPTSLELLTEQALKCLHRNVWDCKNGYLNIYHFNGSNPRTLTDFTYISPSKN